MDLPWILIVLTVLIILLAIVFFVKKVKNKKREKITPLTSLAFVFIIAGIVFNDPRAISYSLFGIAVIISIIDIVINKTKKRN